MSHTVNIPGIAAEGFLEVQNQLAGGAVLGKLAREQEQKGAWQPGFEF